MSGTRDVLLGWGNGWSMGLEECVLHVLTWATAVAGVVLWDGSELDGWAPFWGDAREGYRGVVGYCMWKCVARDLVALRQTGVG